MPLEKITTKSKPRDVGLDGLRTIGLLAIILAHVGPPAILFQIRNFDVSLMILVSGAVFNLSSGADKNYLRYFLSRVGRLLIPTWVFLIIFFILIYAISFVGGNAFPYSANVIINTFNLVGGIGYVWIIRIFILVAISLPFLIKFYNKLENKKIYLLSLFVIYLIYEVIYFIYSSTHFIQDVAALNFIFQNIIFYIIPYGVIAGLGFYLTRANKKFVTWSAVLFSLIFLGLAYFYGISHFVPTQNFKYPPRAYFLSYGLAVSLALYLLSKTKAFAKIFGDKLLMFISASSLWIYLWQILLLFIWGMFRKYINSSLQNFVIEYIFVVFASLAVTFIQKLIFRKITDKLVEYKNLNGFLKTAFLK